MRIALDEPNADLRQGMTVIIEYTADTRKNALWIPAAAVTEHGGQSRVRKQIKGKKAWQAVEGEFFGNNQFIVTSGVEKNDMVWIERTRNI